MKGYVFKTMMYVDILGQSMIWRDPGLTISARCGLALRKGYPWAWCALGKVLNRIVSNHCEKAIQHDIERAEKAIRILRGLQ